MIVMEKAQEIFIGHVIIKACFSGSKSDGYIAYLFTDKLKHYKLAREGVYGPSDDFFYRFSKKYVQITGSLFQDRILTISEVHEMTDPFEREQSIEEGSENQDS